MRLLKKWIERWADREEFRPMLILKLGVGVTLLIFVTAGFLVWDANFRMIQKEELGSEFNAQAGKLLFALEQRYDRVRMLGLSPGSTLHEPGLAILPGLFTLESVADRLNHTGILSSNVRRLDIIKSRLVVLQDSAFALIRVHRTDAARQVLRDTEYLSLTRNIRTIVESSMETATRLSGESNSIFTAQLAWISIVAGIFLVALAVAWIAVMRLVESHLDRRRQTEAELKESEEKYRTLIDALPHAVLIAQEWKFVFCNPAAVSMFRLKSTDELIGASCLSFVAERDKELAKANADARERHDTGVREYITLTMECPDGTEFPAEVFARNVSYKGREAVQYVVLDLTERTRTESDLRESEDKYRQLIEALPHAVLMMQDSKIVFCNPAAATMFGYSDFAVMIGMPMNALVPEQERARAAEASDKLYRGDERAEVAFQMTLLRRTMEEFPAEVNGRRITSGGRTALQLVILDVTERKHVENAMRESEERFRNLSDTAPILIWMAGVDRHTFYFNKSWLRFTGRSVGQEYGHGWKQNVHPDDLSRCMAAYGGAFDSRTAFTVEYRMHHLDNTYHWVLDTGVPRFSADGSFAGFVGSCVDISTRRAAEEALRESERRFRELADFLPHTIFEADLQGRLTFANQRAYEVLGFAAEDADRGLNVFEMLVETDRERAQANFERVITGERTKGNEYTALTKHGQRIPVMVDTSVSVLDGKVRGVRGMVIDISQQKQAEQDLRQLNRALQTIGQCNQAMIHADDEISLLNEICSIIVQTGGHRMAWVGYVQSEGEKVIVPVAFAGAEQGYLQSVTVSWGDQEDGMGPTGMAIKTLQPCVNRDIAVGRKYKEWQAEAIKRGFRSSIALPLVTGSRCFGSLNIYSGETEAFDDAEVQLLKRLADDVAYGIAALRMREEQSNMEAALREREIALQRTFDQSPIGAGIVSLDGRFLRVNETLCQMLGYTVEELQERSFREISHPDDLGRDLHNIELLEAGDIDLYETDKRYFRKDGSVMWGHLSVCAVKDPAGKALHFLPMVQDITERKQNETLLLEQAVAIDSAMDGVAILDSGGHYLYLNDEHARAYGYDNPAELLGKSWEIFYEEDERKRFNEVIMPRLWREGHWRGSAVGKRKDGNKFRQEIALTRTHTGGLVCIIRDVSQQQLLENVLMDLVRVSDQDARDNAVQLLQTVRRQLALLTSPEDHVIGAKHGMTPGG
jgi:PAS domain S-box-containing protein